MTLQVYNLDKRVRFENKSVTLDAVYGTEVISWVPIATIWAEKQDVLPTRTQAEMMRNGIQVAVMRSRLRLRHRADINATMRCVIGGVTYRIVSESAEIGRNEWMELLIERVTT